MLDSQSFSDMLAALSRATTASALQPALLEQVLNHVPVGIAVAAAPSGKLIFANHQVERILGHPPLPAAEVGEYAQYRVYQRNSAPCEVDELPLVRALRGETVFGESLIYVRSDQRRVMVSVSAAPIRTAAGDLVAAVVAFEDITESVQASQRMDRYVRQLEILAEVAQQINGNLDTRNILTRLVRSAMSLTDAQMGMVGFVEEGALVFSEYHQGDTARPTDYRFPPGYGVPGLILMTKTPYLCHNAADDPHVIPSIREDLNFYNFVTVPILSAKDEVIGCFEILNKQTGSFDKFDVLVLKGLGGSAAVAIQNARLFAGLTAAEASLREAHAELERRVEERTAALTAANEQLREKNKEFERFMDLTAGRELRMIELKNEVAELRQQLLNQPRKVG